MSYGWRPYVPVAAKRKKAEAALKKLQKKGENLTPIHLTGNKIATTFWGRAWCEHIESFSDYSNRLPRGRSYVKNGYVVHLGIKPGEIEALVQGSSLYKVKISIKATTQEKWSLILKSCAGRIDSVLDLLQGKFSKPVMEVMMHKREGLFPQPEEIQLRCSCPDSAEMCKHIAAVMYGVGAKLDNEPELLFLLRKVDPADLLSQATKIPTAAPKKSRSTVSDESLKNIFGIEIDSGEPEKVLKVKTKKAPSALKKKVKAKASAKSKVKAKLKKRNEKG
ncbi:MAG: SWIM zinc finger family protein [Pseudobdellovibrionaceae bacterium]